jgi:GT2 family glycosyltransferase
MGNPHLPNYKSKPFVRIILLNYNQSQYTLNLVNNLNEQSYDSKEIVIVDNASNDVEVDLLRLNLPNGVHVIYSENNLGYAKGNNLGMKLITNKSPAYYFILNNDVIIENNFFLETLLESFNNTNEKSIVAVSPLVDTISLKKPINEQIQVRKLLPTAKLYLICCSIFKPFTKKLLDIYLYKQDMPYANKYMLSDTINGAAFIINADFIRGINYLDEGTFLYFEEIILGRQIKHAGSSCILNGYVSLKHLQGSSTKSAFKELNINMERHKYKSELYYFRKYCNLHGFFVLLFVLFKEIEIFIKRIVYFKIW